VDNFPHVFYDCIRRNTPIKPSTKAFLCEAQKTQKYTWFDRLHGYVYMRWPYFYIGVGKGDHPLSKITVPIIGLISSLTALLPKKHTSTGAGFAEGYHGKALPLAAAQQLVRVNEDISLENLEQIIPFSKARDIILKNPDHIAVIDCPCRKGVEHPCLPLDVCLIVGEPFASFAVEHNPQSARWITSQEAETILQEEDQRGHAHHAFFKDAVLGRFYAICNCCSCCCGAMKAQRNGIPMIISSGYVCQVDRELCIACGECQPICPFGAIQVEFNAEVNPAICMGCGICMQHCSQGVLSLLRDHTRPEPLEIEKLMQFPQGKS